MRFCFTLLFSALLSFCNAQNIGIGTTTPSASSKLEINSTNSGLLIPRMTVVQRNTISSPATGLMIYQTDNTPGFYFYNGSSWIQFSTGSATNYWSPNGIHIYNNNPNNVGIGTTAPEFKLTVQNNGYGLVQSDGTVKVGSYIGGSSGWYGTVSNHPLSFFTNGSGAQMTILQNGNIGIGTTTPVAKLHINQDFEALRLSGSQSYLSFYNGASMKGYLQSRGSDDMELGTAGGNTNGNLDLSIRGTSYLSVRSNGNVGVGTTSPADKLTVLTATANYGLTHTDGAITVGSYVGFGAGWLGTKSNHPLNFFTNNGNASMIIHPNGQVSVNGNASAINPDVNVNFLPPFTLNGSLVLKEAYGPFVEWAITSFFGGSLSFSKNGVAKAYVNNDGEWVEFSDINLKKSISPYKPVLGSVKNLEVSTYRYKSNAADSRSFGLIAQNVAQYFPEIVSETQDRDGNKLLAIAYGKTGVLAIKAIQEQQVIIEKLLQRVEELEKRLSISNESK